MSVVKTILRWLRIGKCREGTARKADMHSQRNPFSPSSVDKLVISLAKCSNMKARRDCVRKEWHVQTTSLGDVLGIFFRLEYVESIHVRNLSLYGNGVFLMATVNECRKIILTTMTDEEEDMAEIRFVFCDKRIMTIHFVGTL